MTTGTTPNFEAATVPGPTTTDLARLVSAVRVDAANQALTAAADHLVQLADTVEARVAEYYGAKSGIGPGSADMLREAAADVRSRTTVPTDVTPDQAAAPHPGTAGLSGSLRPVLLWAVCCSICRNEWEDEYSAGFHDVDTAIEQVLDGGWHQRVDGALVCDADDPSHDAARQDP